MLKLINLLFVFSLSSTIVSSIISIIASKSLVSRKEWEYVACQTGAIASIVSIITITTCIVTSIITSINVAYQISLPIIANNLITLIDLIYLIARIYLFWVITICYWLMLLVNTLSCLDHLIQSIA